MTASKIQKRESTDRERTALFQLELTDLSESIPNGTQIFPLSHRGMIQYRGKPGLRADFSLLTKQLAQKEFRSPDVPSGNLLFLV